MRLIFGGNSDIAKAIYGVRLTRKKCDVSKYNDVAKAFMKYKPTEVVNCAGVIYPSSIINSEYWDWEKEIQTNLVGAYYIARYSAIYDSRMVFIGSTSGLRGRANWSGYSASKAGLISLVQSLGDEGYKAWCLNISRTDTKMRTRLFPNEDKSTLMPPAYIASVVEDCFSYKYPTGSSILVKKDFLEVQ